MPAAEIITIGTEILLGEIVDTNSRFIARKLRDIGIDLYRQTTVGDNAQRIAAAIKDALERCEIIITTGGLGPTIDDPTREAVALAMGVDTEYRSELWDQIKERFKKYGRAPTENNRRQAFVPTGSIAVENPVGSAPAFIAESNDHSVIALPGVPREMEYLLENSILPYLKDHYHLEGIIKARIIHTAGAGESQIDERISDLELLSNPTVGLAAHSGQVDVRITAKAKTEKEADGLIAGIEKEILSRLGDWVYGYDEDTLEETALNVLKQKGWRLVVVEAGLGGELIRRLSSASRAPVNDLEEIFIGGEVLTEIPSGNKLLAFSKNYREKRQADACVGVSSRTISDNVEIQLVLITPNGTEHVTPFFGGPPQYAPRWALNHSLNAIRNL
jgi:competence/damage-inducible protein CinA-like protein